MGIDLSPVAPVAERAPGSARVRVDPGAVLAWVSAGPALASAGWLVATYPLAVGGIFTPLLAGTAGILAAALLVVAARRLPAVEDTPWWSVAATLAVATAFGLFTAAHAAGHVILRRDSAVYALLGRWLSDTGGLYIPARLEFIGAPDAVVTARAPGLYPAGADLTAQFMSGTALTLAPAGWGGAGWGAILLVPALLGALALLAFAGLAARLVGARWAPAAAAGLGLLQPVLLTARSTYSEPLAQLLLLGALCLLLDALLDRRRATAALAGLLLGLGLLVRIDAVRDLGLLVPIVAWLALRRHPAWWPLALGACAGAAYGVLDALGPAQAYVSDLAHLVRTAAYGGTALIVVAAVAVPLLRDRRWPLPSWAPAAAAGTVALGLLALALRPVFWTGYGTGGAWPFIESLQREQGLPPDGQRSYAEQTLHWVSWYAGVPALLLAGVAAVALTYAVVRGRAERWALGLGVPLVSAVLVLLSPSITPDHPWADRRLVPTVLPVVVLLALWAVAAAARHAGRWSRPVLAVGLVAVLLPPVLGSRALAFTRTEQGEPAAADAACAAFAPGEVALLVDARSRQEWTAVLREACDVPAFGVPGLNNDDIATRAQVADVAARVRAAGGVPVLVAQSGDPLPRLTDRPQRRIVDLDTSEHERLITRPPTGLTPLSIELWRADPA
jgi:hypothetical protein